MQTFVFFIFLISKVGALGGALDNFTDVIEHMLPAYAIARKSELLVESKICRKELESFREGVDRRKLWSLRMLDSSGSPKPGFIYGNNYWVGSRSQCLDTMNPEPLELHPKWLKNNSLYRNPEEEIAPYQLNYFAAHLRHNSTLQYHYRRANEDLMVLGLCLPASCATSDLKLILEKLFEERIFSINAAYGMDLKLLYVKDLKDDPYQYLPDWRMIIVILIMILTAVLMFMGTCYDITVHQKKIRLNKLTYTGENNIENGGILKSAKVAEEEGLFWQFLMCFSIYTNTQKIFATPDKNSLTSLNGLRFMTMVWVILLHSLLFVKDYADNGIWALRLSSQFASQMLVNGSLSVDTYFFLSGFLLAHIFFRNREEQENLGKKSNGPMWRKLMGFIALRFVRLTPAYMMTVGIIELTGSILNNTSQFYMSERPQDTCSKYWWRNLLYINNLFNRQDMCVSWSWYVSNDSQFFLFGAILLLISVKHFYTAAGILVATLLASSIVSGYLPYHYEYVPTLDEQWNTASTFYDPPWMRIGPYIVGLATAYFLLKIKNKLHLEKRTLWGLWTLGPCVNLLILFGLYDRTLSPIALSIYMALHRTAWGIGIAWVVIACVTNNGGIVNSALSLKAWAPFSKLTYTAYLFNPFIINTVSLISESPFHIDFFPNSAVILGYVVSTYLWAYLATLMFEAPYILLLKMCFERKKKESAAEPTTTEISDAEEKPNNSTKL